MIGVWATNPSVGDIFGTQLYVHLTKDNKEHWGYTFMILGVCVQVVALINFFFLIEYPSSKGIVIKEKASVFNPD